MVYHLLAEYITQPVSAQNNLDWPKFIAQATGNRGRTGTPLQVLAERAGMHITPFNRWTTRLAATTYFCSRLWVSSLLSHLVEKQRQGVIVLQTILTYLMMDETPIRMRSYSYDSAYNFVDFPASKQKVDSTDSMLVPSETQIPPRPPRTDTADPCKIIQAKSTLSLSYTVVATDETVVLEIPLTIPLYHADHMDAEVTRICALMFTYSPLLDASQEHWKHRYHLCTEDRASSNIKSEAVLALEDKAKGILRCTMDCDYHNLDTCQGYVCNLVPTTISGTINLSCTMAAGGSTAALRICMAQVLLDSVVVLMGPYPRGSDACKANNAFWDRCLPKTLSGYQRKHVLQRNLHSDLTCDTIYLCTLAENPDLQRWADETAKALLPCRTPLLQRHRWMQSEAPLTSTLLITYPHSLLHRATPAWLRKLRGQKPLPNQGPSSWSTALTDSSSSDCEAATEDHTTHSLVPCPGPNSSVTHVDKKLYWAEFNKRTRQSAAEFAEANPIGELLVAQGTLLPQIRLLHSLEHLYSKKWMEEEFVQAIKGRTWRTRFQHLATRKTFTTVYHTIWQNMHESIHWHSHINIICIYTIKENLSHYTSPTLSGNYCQTDCRHVLQQHWCLPCLHEPAAPCPSWLTSLASSCL